MPKIKLQDQGAFNSEITAVIRRNIYKAGVAFGPGLVPDAYFADGLGQAIIDKINFILENTVIVNLAEQEAIRLLACLDELPANNGTDTVWKLYNCALNIKKEPVSSTADKEVIRILHNIKESPTADGAVNARMLYSKAWELGHDAGKSACNVLLASSDKTILNLVAENKELIKYKEAVQQAAEENKICKDNQPLVILSGIVLKTYREGIQQQAKVDKTTLGSLTKKIEDLTSYCQLSDKQTSSLENELLKEKAVCNAAISKANIDFNNMRHKYNTVLRKLYQMKDVLNNDI